jgi:fructoselysine-6-P-deglycase FrlB-like protein
VKASEFLDDVRNKADNLERLSGYRFDWPDLAGKRLFVVGMGSSYFLAQWVCRRLQMSGINAFALLASSRDIPALSESDVVIAISATGKSVETVSFVDRVDRPVVFLTNNPTPPLPAHHLVVGMNSLPETGGVASLSYQATIVALLDLEKRLTGQGLSETTLIKASEATRWIIDTSLEWQHEILEQVTAGDGVQFVAPLERLSSAQQSALMIRECPRLRAEASEAGDWAHIDVYLTKNHDLRLVVFAGSPWQEQVLDWTTERKRRVVLIGGHSDRVDVCLTYPHHDDDIVALLTETTFAELVAAQLWHAQG